MKDIGMSESTTPSWPKRPLEFAVLDEEETAPSDSRPAPSESIAERDLGLILRNRNDQLVALAHKHRDMETALLLVCDAVTLAEAKRIAREAIQA